MGRLIGLELHNFKSYRGTASVGFGTSHFTSIIGPNGAGKSNMMDAISFVLGVQSSHLRSAHLKDLIYRGKLLETRDVSADVSGSENESDNNSANPTRAYVMALYERSNGDILKLKRTITLTGSSEYRINDKVVSATDYSTVLKKENILIKARNFLVFQGDVEQIASQSPLELTKLIETISGSNEYKREYESLREEQEKAHENANTFFQRKRVLNGELKQYKEQKTESEYFEKKMTEKKNLIRTHKLWQLYYYENSKNNLIDQLEAKNDELKRAESVLKKEERILKASNAEYSKENLNIIKQKSAVDKKKQAVDSLNKDLLPVTTKRDLTIKKLADVQRRIKEIKLDISTQETNIKELDKQKEVVKKALKIFESKNFSKDDFDLPDDGKELYEKLKQDFLFQGGALQEGELNELYNDKHSLMLQLENLEQQKANLHDRLSGLNQNLKSFGNQLDDNKFKLDETTEDLTIKKNYLNESRTKKERLLSREFEINTQIKEILLKLDDYNASQRENNRERKLRENINNLQRLFPGVKGLVCDLCKPKQKKYETAVSTILGKSFDSIIVDNITVAQKCIAYLKEQRAGVASFIPLDSVDSKPPNSNLRHVHPNARPVLDVIEYDPVLERAIQYACGNSVVCDEMSVAKSIRWSKGIDVKIVTLDGSLIHKSGLMTGGKGQNDGKSWGKSELNELIKKKDELLDELSVIQHQKPSEIAEKQTLNEISELENILPLLSNANLEIQRNIDDINKELSYQKQNLQSVEGSLNQKNISLVEINSTIAQKEERIKELQSTIYASFTEQYDIDIGEYEKAHGQILRDKEYERAKFMKQISSLDSKLEFEKERVNQSKGRLELLLDEETGLNEKLELIRDQRNEIRDKIDGLETEMEQENTRISKAEEKLKSNMDFIKSVEDKVAGARAKFEQCFKKCSSLEEDIEKEIMHKIDILRNCKIENVDIPLLEGTLDSISIGENPDNLIEISEDIVIDYSKLPNKFRNIQDARTANHEFTEKIKKADEELERLSPNAKALERLRDVENRLKDVEENHARTRDYESSVAEKFSDIKEKRYDTFMKAFDFISNKIDTTYKELTKSNASPLGGSAYLTLEDEEEPYNAGIKYHAMPPLKRFRDMELLSGGEKTVAALALLFAIHSFQPSPFFVLDEVDAALDNANVQRVANYISSNAGPEFQFIVISLKNGLFEKSDALVGIYREQVANSSKTLTLDLRTYPQ